MQAVGDLGVWACLCRIVMDCNVAELALFGANRFMEATLGICREYVCIVARINIGREKCLYILSRTSICRLRVCALFSMCLAIEVLLNVRPGSGGCVFAIYGRRSTPATCWLFGSKRRRTDRLTWYYGTHMFACSPVRYRLDAALWPA